jgi:hypothetical protein
MIKNLLFYSSTFFAENHVCKKLIFDIYRQVRYSFLELKREERSSFEAAFHYENKAIILINEH